MDQSCPDKNVLHCEDLRQPFLTRGVACFVQREVAPLVHGTEGRE